VPANLPPDYYAAESAFRAATTPQTKREALERMLAIMPKHKGTDHLRAELRSRMAKLAQEISRQHGGGHADAYVVHREGAGQAVLIGPPNAGKSSLLQAMTHAEARTGEYPFTTQLPQPAMMPFEDIQVQLVDLPAVSPGATPAWLRGLVHEADLLLLLVDLDADPIADLQTVFSELAALHVGPGTAGVPSDAADEPRPALVVGTKLELPGSGDGAELLRMELADRLPLLATSANSGAGLDALRQQIFDALQVVRVYAKPPGRPADMTRPFVFPRGSTVEDLADTIHHEVRQKLQYAVRWPTANAPLRVARQYELRDRDVIELHTV
jgi:ribosome-interacting GTPase 1